MNMTDTVLVTPKDGRPEFEAIIMGFAEEKVKVEWKEKAKVFRFFQHEELKSEYFSRSELKKATFEDEYEAPDSVTILWDKCMEFGWIDIQQGRWSHEEPVTGTIGIKSKGIGNDFEKKISGGNLIEVLQGALITLQKHDSIITKTKNQNEQ
jgi:hypothetical protein